MHLQQLFAVLILKLDTEMWSMFSWIINLIQINMFILTCQKASKLETRFDFYYKHYINFSAFFLWFKKLSLSFKNLDFTLIFNESCCLTNSWIIVFFYVDNIILIFCQHNIKKFEALKIHLFMKYEFHDQKELRWFLNIQIIYNRQAQKLYFTQNIYIDKIIQWFDLQSASHVYKFLFWNILQFILYDKRAILNEIQAYQKYINSLIYLTNILHINIAHSTSFLAQFMQNSFSIHAIKIDHLIIYLHNHKWLSLVMNDNTDLSNEFIKIFENSNNASYSDNLITCQNSEKYIFYFFDCLIDWWIIWQNTVMIFTTEAELLTLTHISKQIMWW